MQVHVGFVFDCVKEYLAAQPSVVNFPASVARLVDVSVEEYPRLGYEHRTVCFGCTGGWHRSVYCAVWMCARLREKGCDVTPQHVALEQLLHLRLRLPPLSPILLHPSRNLFARSS